MSGLIRMENKMSEVILDENGYELDENGVKKIPYNPYSLKKKDVIKIVAEFAEHFSDADDKLKKMFAGVSFSDGDDAIKNLLRVVEGGSVIKFYRSCNWLSDSTSKMKFLNGKDNDTSYDEKLLVDELFTLIGKTADFRKEFSQFLLSCVTGSLLNAFYAIRFEEQMLDLVRDADVEDIAGAFKEFAEVFDSFYDAMFFVDENDPNADSTNVLAEVHRHMRAEIAHKSHLNKFITDATAFTPAGLNRLYLYDRLTKRFSTFNAGIDAMRTDLERCKELNKKSSSFYSSDDIAGYMASFSLVLDRIEEILQRGIDSIRTFLEKKKESPYAIMHYDITGNYITKYALGTVGDPVKDGTTYLTYFAEMMTLLKKVAKQAVK